MIFALLDCALPWTRVCLLVFGEVTWALEFLVTARLTAAFRCKLSCRGRTLAASHRAEDRLIILGFLAHRSLESHGFFGVLVDIDWKAGGDGDSLTVLLDADEFGRFAVLCQTAVKSDFISPVSDMVSKGCSKEDITIVKSRESRR